MWARGNGTRPPNSFPDQSGRKGSGREKCDKRSAHGQKRRIRNIRAPGDSEKHRRSEQQRKNGLEHEHERLSRTTSGTSRLKVSVPAPNQDRQPVSALFVRPNAKDTGHPEP
jgi:hypothetical protein